MAGSPRSCGAAGDLDVDGALARAVAAAGELLARDVRAGAVAEDGQDLALALGDADDLVLAPQLAAVEAEHEGPEADRSRARPAAPARLGDRAPEDVAEAQDQLARLEGLRQVVVGADLEAGDAVLGFARAVSIRIGTPRARAQAPA